MDISSGAASLKAGETTTITFTFSEDINDTSFTLADIALESGSLGTLNKVSETVYTALYTPDTDVEDPAVQISIAANKFADLADNQNAVGDTLEIAVDTSCRQWISAVVRRA